MGIQTGIPTVHPEPKLGRISTESKAKNPSSLLEWNRKMRAATRGMGPKDKLPEGFERLRVLSLMWDRREAGYYPSGKPFEETTSFKEVGSIQLSFPANIEVIGGQMKSNPVTKTLYLPGRTTAGDHITANYTPEQCARAIIADPNWCSMYVVCPMTAEEDAREAGLSQDEEFLATAEHRKRLMDEVFEENRKAGLLPSFANISKGGVPGSD